MLPSQLYCSISSLPQVYFWFRAMNKVSLRPLPWKACDGIETFAWSSSQDITSKMYWEWMITIFLFVSAHQRGELSPLATGTNGHSWRHNRSLLGSLSFKTVVITTPLPVGQTKRRPSWFHTGTAGTISTLCCLCWCQCWCDSRSTSLSMS